MGRLMAETIHVIIVQGEQRLLYSGYELPRPPSQTTLRSLQRRHAMPIRFKKTTNLIAVLVLTFVFAGCAGAPVKPEHITRGDYESTKQYLTQLIQYEMKKHDVTGLSIALVDDQQIVWAQGF